jgi:transposase
MDTHKNAPLTPKGREAMVRRVIEGGVAKAAAALQFNVTAKNVAKWVKRFRAEGVDGLRDRSSRPHSLPSQTASATCTAIETLRRLRHTGKHIATEVGVSAATVSWILRRLAHRRVRHMPVLRDGKLAGIVSIGDVVKHRLEDLELETNVLRDVYNAAR